MKKHLLKLVTLLMLAGVVLLALNPRSSSHAQSSGYLHTQGSEILDSAGNPVIFTGINWFGLETESYAPHGLWARSLDSLLDQIVQLGFNVIRLPYSNQLLDPGSVPNGINYELNPDLKGLNGLQIMDKLIAGAGQRGLKVILDRHRPDSHAQSELWYTSQYSQERWIQDWVMLAKRYAGNDTVIGADLHNEPHGRATWGSGDPATDWRLAAEKAGNAILAVNPNWLIIVQGVDHVGDDWYWWGGNLSGARQYPVQLDVPGRLVYSTHVYGPGVYPQPWFSDPTFPDNLPAIWESHWSYLQKENTAPVVVGEFGGRSVGNDKEGIWQRTLVSYLAKNRISYFYWTLNPDSGDTGGVLLNDWQSVDPGKKALLSGYQFPLLGIEQRGAQPATQLPPPAPPTPTPGSQSKPPAQNPPATPTSAPVPSLTNPSASPGVPTIQAVQPSTASVNVKYHSDNTVALARETKADFIITNSGTQPLPLSQVELFYWINPQDNLQSLEFHCDWAAFGCENLLGDFHSTDGGNAYLRLHFSAASPTLSAGADSGEIKIRFNRSDWSEFHQDQDYSYSPTTSYVEWSRVTLAVGGVQVWGQSPNQTPAASTQAATTAELSPSVAPSTVEPLGQAGPGATLSPTPSGYPAADPNGQLPAAQPGIDSSASGMQIMASVVLGSALGVLAIWAFYRLSRRIKQKDHDND